MFAERGIQVVGIEPNADMRAQAEAAALADGLPRPRYLNGQAEATGLADGQADAVLAAQAFHWFHADAALHEFHRMLRPSGWVMLMWNERDERDAFTAAYGDVIRTAPQTNLIEGNRGTAGEVLLRCPFFGDARRVCFANEQSVDEDGMIERALSASYAPREPEAQGRFTAALREVFRTFQDRGRVVLRYETSIFAASKGVV
jgi:SAM-dependent methyltransferase